MEKHGKPVEKHGKTVGKPLKVDESQLSRRSPEQADVGEVDHKELAVSGGLKSVVERLQEQLNKELKTKESSFMSSAMCLLLVII